VTAGAAGPSGGGTLSVANTNDNGPGSLRQAVLDANPGDTIAFDPGVTGTITLTDPIEIDQDLAIEGPGADVLSVSGGDATQVFFIFPLRTVSISGLTIEHGRAVSHDGAGIIHLGADLTIRASVLSSNASIAFPGLSSGCVGGRGGAVLFAPTAMSSSLTILDTTFVGNSASHGGSGIHVFGNLSPTITIVNSTLSGNFVAQALPQCTFADQSALWLGGSATLSHGTVVDNAGGIRAEGSSVTLKNTLLAGNGAGDCTVVGGGTIVDLGGNIDSDGTCGTATTSAALDLEPLADNGGPTPTHALGPASAAIDAAPDCLDAAGNPVASDQRGVSRPGGAGCDVGAYEAAGSTLSATKVMTTAGPLHRGDTVEYEIVVTNQGPGSQADAPEAELTDVLPPELELLSASADVGAAAANLGTNTVTWNGALGAAASATIAVTARIADDAPIGGAVSNQAVVAFDTDNDGVNDGASASDDPGAPGPSDPTAFVVLGTIVDVPALGVLTRTILALVLAAVGVAALKR
jgi:uncharacterized repeat protein (TIGR01451 family)